MDLVPRDIHHRGCRIVWDARPATGTNTWTARVAVVVPARSEQSARVYRLGEHGGFSGEDEARDHVIGAAKNWIDGHWLSAELRPL
jgi:hypothetical protein